jgi:hypothetical protein
MANDGRVGAGWKEEGEDMGKGWEIHPLFQILDASLLLLLQYSVSC